MSFADERTAIEKRLGDNWSTTTIAYENVPFSEPTDGEYVSIHILTGDGLQVDISPTPRHRFVGIIQITVVVPSSGGTHAARGYADTLGGYFRNASFSQGSSGTIQCRTPAITSLGVADGQYRLVLRIPYERDAIY